MKTGYSSSRRDAGMTLVEVLLVVFIMGLAAGVAVMTLPERKSPQEKAVATIRTAVEDLRDRALLTGEVLGLQIAEGGFQVVSWTGEEWMPVRHQPVALPKAVRVRLAPSKDDGQRLDEKGPLALVFNPLGVSEPVRLEVSRGLNSDLLEITPEGEVIDAGELE